MALECIVSDDGSTDGTAAIVEGLAARDPRLVRAPPRRATRACRRRATTRWTSPAASGSRSWTPTTACGRAVWARCSAPRTPATSWRSSASGSAPTASAPGSRRCTNGTTSGGPGTKSIAANPGLLYYVGPVGKLFHRSCAEGLRFEGRMLGDQPWVVRALVRAGDRIGVIEDVVYEWWRPHPDRHVPTITSARTDSAALGSEAVGMAGLAFDVVSAEFGRAYDPATRARLEGVYFGRLVRADLGAQVRGAARRGDPALADLLRALAALVARVPAAAVAGSDAVVAELIQPAAGSWRRLSAAERHAFWALFDAARARRSGRPRARPQPSAPPRASRRDGPRPVGRQACGALLYAGGLLVALHPRFRGRPVDRVARPGLRS